ncbi:hypothetical protein A0H81_11554 [Grifola frondosa]|uniref:Uncharacterized protein n=1 Tax=Grifola frondosa TaxID=5627 RepID=A0A1C7LWV6_GRIFR|nr:hypothetical protein A0H81_11554 [Grifola frondosa]
MPGTAWPDGRQHHYYSHRPCSSHPAFIGRICQYVKFGKHNLNIVADAWSNSKGDSWFRARYVTRRYIILFVVVIAALSLALRAVWIKTSAGRALAVELETPEVPAQQSPQRLPPLYSQFHAYELELPQHKVERVPGESKLLLAAWSWTLVWLGIFVFDNYTWNPDGPDYSDWNGHTIPSRIPLTALLQGPIAGGHSL